MATALQNTVSGKSYSVYMRTQGAPKSENKLLMCQTDFSLSQSKNVTTSETKCGTKTQTGPITREATVNGELAMPVASDLQDYIDLVQLQDYFEVDVYYSFTLMPDAGATLSTGKLQVIDFDGKFNAYNQQWPMDGSATFDTTISIDEKPVYSDYIEPTT